jgi:cation diffusion facilitator family transporter
LSAKQNISIQRWVVFFSLLLFSLKLIGYYYTHSVAVLSDALESIVNVVTAFVGWYSLYISAQPRDQNHPYGHGKIEFISAAIEGTLIVVAGVMILIESLDSYIFGSPLQDIDNGILFIGATAIINFLLGSFCIKIGQKNHSLALVASGKHLQTDTITTVGIIIGLVVIKFTNWTILDSLIAFGLGWYVIYTGYKILRESISGIMDEADDELLSQLVDTLNKNRSENWIDIHNTRIIKYGSILHIDCHLTMPWFFNLKQVQNETDKLQSAILEQFGDRIEVFIHNDPCDDFSCQICTKSDCEVRKKPFEQKINWNVDNMRIDQKHQI